LGLDDFIAEYRRRCAGLGHPGAARRVAVRRALWREAGGLSYDEVEAEFQGLRRRLEWPAAATLKDLRHLFATVLHNAGTPEGYRRYLLGHAPGREAAVAYTHLSDLERHYAAALRGEGASLLASLQRRLACL
jgi:hypothetical protein